ncbi:hypothetical protein [Streptomyces sp. NPDC000405]|uniref:hypothetical protein n=1 Tax=Streptomyces sp. NPDC000405 TaxID=3161033 RepID=UPI00398CB593
MSWAVALGISAYSNTQDQELPVRLISFRRGAHRWLTFGMTTAGALRLLAGLVFAREPLSFPTDAQQARRNDGALV